MQNCVLWSWPVYKSLAISSLVLAADCTVPAHSRLGTNDELRALALKQIESVTHPARSLQVERLHFSDVWEALPAAREHRAMNTAKVLNSAEGTVAYASFFRESGGLEIDIDDRAPGEAEEVTWTLLRVVREVSGRMIPGYATGDRFAPPAELRARLCQSRPRSPSRFADQSSVGWVCESDAARIDIEVHPNCAKPEGEARCILLQVSAKWGASK